MRPTYPRHLREFTVQPDRLGHLGGGDRDAAGFRAPTFLQHAGVVAIRDGEKFIAEFVARCRAARDVAVEALQACRRVEVVTPEGAFYAFPRVDGVKDSLEFAKEVLRRTKVGLAPGSAFGPMGEGHLRLCFARDPRIVAEAVDRLRPLLD